MAEKDKNDFAQVLLMVIAGERMPFFITGLLAISKVHWHFMGLAFTRP